jgi:mRNA-degrading endonuclease RelE of RelBE toxin-antitoxin system
MSQRYRVRYAQESITDLRGFRSFDQRAILEGIERHLTTQPTQVSRSRIKAMVQPFWSQYRLRFGEFRVYYDVDDVARQVSVLRILKKGRQTTPEEAP